MRPTKGDIAAYAHSTYEWQTAWTMLPAARFRAREWRCERLVELGMLESQAAPDALHRLYRRCGVKPPLLVVAAAVRYQGVIFSLPKPHRHYQIVHTMTAMGLPPFAHREQGFLLSDGTYTDRSAAWIVARDAHQLIGQPHYSKELFTEDLW